MTAGEDQQNATESPRPNPLSAPLRGAVMAAGLLEEACAPGAGDPLRLEVVRTLSRELAGELRALSVPADSETVAVEGALWAANLAACVVPELTEARATQAAAAVSEAAGAARALCLLAEAGTAGTGAASGERMLNALGDVRGAAWRARLAVRQMDEFFESEG